MENRLKLKKVSSLTRRSDFSQIKKLGKRVRSGSWLVLTYLENERGFLRVGWTIPGKYAGAVVRNRLKRWGREYFRRLPPEEKKFGFDINIFVGGASASEIKKILHGEFAERLDEAWTKLMQRARRFEPKKA